MPKYGPRKQGVDRFAREVMQEIEDKQRVLLRALGLEPMETLRAGTQDVLRAGASLRAIRQEVERIETRGELEAAVERSVLLGRRLLDDILD